MTYRFLCFLITLLVLAGSCAERAEERNAPPPATNTPAPADSTPTVSTIDQVEISERETSPPPPPAGLPATGDPIIASATGDLDRDEREELVLVTEAPDPAEPGNQLRTIRIYQQEQGEWELWETFPIGVLGSEEGGTMGDPFQGIDIERGSIVIDHFGGSRQKWKYTHRYRYQHEAWELIGATILFGAPCEYWKSYDYNLSTGQIAAEASTEDCATEEETTETYTFRHVTKPLPRLGTFRPGENGVALPEGRGEFYY